MNVNETTKANRTILEAKSLTGRLSLNRLDGLIRQSIIVLDVFDCQLKSSET